MKDSIKRILRDFPEKHPYLPLGLSIIGATYNRNLAKGVIK